MTILEIEGVQIQLFGEESRETVPVFYLPVLEEDEGRMVWEGLDAPCVLACVKCGDWNRELSPWRADRAVCRLCHVPHGPLSDDWEHVRFPVV